jgi:site-specific DNA-adenine methylase
MGVGLKPFFTFYGGKWRSAHRYPRPLHGIIVEPFAGSAGYSVRHANANVLLYDIDEHIVGTWQYLIRATSSEIRALPLYDGSWESVDDLGICQEAKWLIGWWLNKGCSSPCKRPSAWMRQEIRPKSMWGTEIRERIARQVDGIRHWRIAQSSYVDVPLVEDATWFVDPPYQVAGRHYRHGSSGVYYEHLSGWCRSLPGQVIVCEGSGANWLPFVDSHWAKSTGGKHGGKRAIESIWTNSGRVL